MNKDIQKIYNIAFDLIELRLNNKEQVVPFSITLEHNKEEPVVTMYEQKVKKPAEQVEIIRKYLMEKIQKNEIYALCLCYDMYITHPRTGSKTDAVLIELADTEGVKNIYIPYNFDDIEIMKKPFQIPSSQKYFS